MKMISVTEDGNMLQSEPMTAPEMSGILLNGILGSFRYIAAQQETEEDKRKFLEELYDMFNVQATVLLNQLIPEKELRPDLTEQAIMEAENAILDREFPDEEIEGQNVLEFPVKPVDEE